MGKKARCRGGRIACLYLVMVLVVLLTAGTVSAAEPSEGVKTVDPVNQSDNYSAVLYDNTNGLPTAEANAIV